MDFRKEELWLLRKKKLTMGWSGFNLAAMGLPAINEAITKRVGFIEQQEKELLADRYCCCSYCALIFLWLLYDDRQWNLFIQLARVIER